MYNLFILLQNAEVYRCLSQALELDPAHQEAIEMKEDRMAEAKKLQSQCVKYLLLGQQSGALRKISTAIECYPEEAEFHVLRCACVCVVGECVCGGCVGVSM